MAQIRKQNKITQNELRRLTRMRSHHTIADIETGKRCPTLAMIWRICDGLGTKPSEVMALVEKDLNLKVTSKFKIYDSENTLGVKTVLGQLIHDLRTQQGLSKNQVADQAGLTHLEIRKIEEGKISPTMFIMIKIAEVLKVKPSILVNSVEAELKKRERIKRASSPFIPSYPEK